MKSIGPEAEASNSQECASSDHQTRTVGAVPDLISTPVEVREHQSSVLIGETGSGKTTQAERRSGEANQRPRSVRHRGWSDTSRPWKSDMSGEGEGGHARKSSLEKSSPSLKVVTNEATLLVRKSEYP